MHCMRDALRQRRAYTLALACGLVMVAQLAAPCNNRPYPESGGCYDC